jgi:carotenoid 1,2-hydratase
MNLALYGTKPRWAMTERGKACLRRTADTLQIGPSSLHWNGATLTADINEISVPIPRRLKGNIRLTPSAIQPETFQLDPESRHRWRPIAPQSRIEVTFQNPALTWSGTAYLDTNNGDRPLAQDFSSWHWSRTTTPGNTTILYDTSSRNLALQINEAGHATPFTPPPTHPLPTTAWGIPRQTRADPGHPPTIIKTLENTPFYARSHIRARLNGTESEALHESLSLTRFSAPWVHFMLPFRMPRRP